MSLSPIVTKRWIPAALAVAVVVVGGGYAVGTRLADSTPAADAAVIASCSSSATFTYDTAFSAALPGHQVTTAPIDNAPACRGLRYRLTMSGAGDVALAEATGILNSNGDATPDFSADAVPASAVTGLRLVIIG